MPAGAVGAVRPVGAILPTATAAGPYFHEATGGYAAPTASAGQSCSDTFPWLATPIWHWPKQIVPNDAAANYDVSRQTGLHLRDKATRNLWDVLSSGQSPLFSTLLATAVPYYILTIRKLADSMNVKRQVRKGVLAWAFGRSIHIICWHTIAYNKKNKTNKCQEGRKLFTSSKI